jgi:hypothetical protein
VIQAIVVETEIVLLAAADLRINLPDDQRDGLCRHVF